MSLLSGWIDSRKSHLSECLCTWSLTNNRMPFSHILRDLRTVQTAFPIRDRVQFILDVLFPESIIHALAALQGVSGQEAEDLFLGGPEYSVGEVEEFNRKIGQQLKKEGML
ncbi:PWWP domain-containing DNA repair factor 3A-like [Polypterus senegalus]|uniref:PWWP domain-containing DNA repair factor 3A-like n=1 Tax=Polypterus senegalus TaxID=55291 RepID=UPI001964CBF0|nr:PWWP domain-containing DNA repair factor 3A-like [Polypterus senegalus]